MRFLQKAALCVLCFGSLGLTGCGLGLGSASSGDVTANSYVLKSVDGKPYGRGMLPAQPSLQFSNNMEVSGSVCNRFAARAGMTDSVLKTNGPLMSTRMACPDERSSDVENTLRGMLEKGVKVSMKGDALILSKDERVLEFELKK